MKNTKYLFDESTKTPAGMVSVSQLQSFLSCRKKWAYGYIENLTPRVDRAYLTIGRLCHKGMQTSMTTLWELQGPIIEDAWRIALDDGLRAIDTEWDKYMGSTPILPEEVPEFEQMLADAKSVFAQAWEEFEPWRYEVLTLQKNGKPIPALELHFVVPCQPTKGLHGFIDAILREKETGFVWCTDYKFRKTIAPDEDEAFNIQNAVYAYACQKMGVEITGTMTWQHLNTPAAEPALLKNGSVSRAKIKTTWAKFAEFCERHGVDPEPYREEMQEKLAGIDWFRATLEYRNAPTIDRIWSECVVPAAKGVKSAYGKSANNFRSLYPWNCKMCQYQRLCQAELRDHDADYIRKTEYVMRPSVTNKQQTN